MTIQDLIDKFTELRDQYGDNTVTFRVRDNYGRYGEDMTPMWMPHDKFYVGTFTHDDRTMIEFSLDDKRDPDTGKWKSPKITFRKS